MSKMLPWYFIANMDYILTQFSFFGKMPSELEYMNYDSVPKWTDTYIRQIIQLGAWLLKFVQNFTNFSLK